MSSKQKSFEERLAELRQQDTGAEQPPKEPRTSPKPSRGPRRVAYVLLIALGALLPALALGFAFKEVTAAMTPSQMASVDTRVDAPTYERVDPGGFTGYVGRMLGLYDSRDPGPLSYLPPARDGWFRITVMDARNPDILDEIHQAWPGSSQSLAQNPGYRHLLHFLKIYRKPDFEQRVLAKTSTRAMYLHPKGEFMSVRMQFASDKNALGPRDDRATWIEALAKRLEARAERNEIVERNKLAGHEIVNLTMAEGHSPIRRPIGYAHGARNALRISVPLTHRVIMSIDGVTTPKTVGKLISAVDKSAVAAHLE